MIGIKADYRLVPQRKLWAPDRSAIDRRASSVDANQVARAQSTSRRSGGVGRGIPSASTRDTRYIIPTDDRAIARNSPAFATL
jgi:hypothetical protein